MKNILKFIANRYNNLLSANGSYEDDSSPLYAPFPKWEDRKFLIIITSCFRGEGSEVQKRTYFSPSQKEEMFTMQSAFLWVAIFDE